MSERSAGDAACSVPPVHRAFALLRRVPGGGRCRNVNQTVKSPGVNRTTMIRLLHTREAEGMIERIEGDAGWRLDPGMIALAADALKSRDVVHVSRLPVHAITVGSVLLSHPPAKRLARFSPGPGSRRSRREWRPRCRRWSVSNFERGLGSCAAPVFDHRGRVIAAINVTGPAEAFESGGAREARIEAAVKARRGSYRRSRLAAGDVRPDFPLPRPDISASLTSGQMRNRR